MCCPNLAAAVETASSSKRDLKNKKDPDITKRPGKNVKAATKQRDQAKCKRSAGDSPEAMAGGE